MSFSGVTFFLSSYFFSLQLILHLRYLSLIHVCLSLTILTLFPSLHCLLSFSLHFFPLSFSFTTSFFCLYSSPFTSFFRFLFHHFFLLSFSFFPSFSRLSFSSLLSFVLLFLHFFFVPLSFFTFIWLSRHSVHSLPFAENIPFPSLSSFPSLHPKLRPLQPLTTHSPRTTPQQSITLIFLTITFFPSSLAASYYNHPPTHPPT